MSFLALRAVAIFLGIALGPGHAQGGDSDVGTPYRKLIDAVVAGDTQAMAEAVAAGAPVNHREEHGMTPLAHAIESHQMASFRWLLQNGADIGLQETTWEYGPQHYPLSFAIKTQNWDAFQDLLKAGARSAVPELSNSSASPVNVAFLSGDGRVFKALEDTGVNWRRPGISDSPLQAPIAANNAEAVRFLLEGRADANEPMGNGNYPLADAAVVGNPEIVKALLVKGADPNVINQGRPVIHTAQTLPHTALINAVRRNSLSCVELLLKAGADPKALDNAAIKWADLLGNEPIYNLLLKSGAEKPAPHAFLDLPQFKEDGAKPERKETSFSDWDFLAAVNAAPTDPSPGIGKVLSVAVISLSEKTAEASSLLAASFSKLPGVALVERDELRALGREHALQNSLNALNAAQSGSLEGADAVVLLAESGGTIELRAVDASSGLVIFSTVMSGKKVLPASLDGVAASTLQAASKLRGDLSGHLLVSLPILTASRSTPEVDLFTRQLSSTLAMFLGAQSGIYVLDRAEMRRLSLEKDLKADLSAFVRSGLLIDGGIDLSPNRKEEVTLTLRASTIDGKERAVAKVTGTLGQPGKLLGEAGKALLASLGKPKAAELERGSEAEAYYRQARAAYDSQLWPQAHALAQAAEALGASGDEFLKFRILTICRLLRSDLQAITEGKYAAKENEREILARCMPLDFLPEAITPRNTGDYLDLAQELLDLVAPIVYQAEAPSKKDQCFWEYLPTVFAAASLPLELTISLSDREAYAAEFESLRGKLLAQSETAIARTKQWTLYSTFRGLVCQRCRLLCFWIDDESRVIAEVLKTIEEAHRLEPPYLLHSLMKGATSDENAGTPLRIGSRLSTFPERLSAALAASDVPHARLKGLLRMRDWAIGDRARALCEQQLAEAYEKVLLFDHTPAGSGSHTEFEENPPTLKSFFPDGPEVRTYIEPWYPEPCFGTKKLRTELTTKRLEYLAEHGLGSIKFFVDPKELDAKTLAKWLQLCEAALAKFEAGPVKDLFPDAARYFREYRITPLTSALGVRSTVNAATPAPAALGPVKGILAAQLPEFHGKRISEPGRTLNLASETRAQAGIWVRVGYGGFVHLSPETKVLEVIPFPEGFSSGSLLATNGDYLAADLSPENSSGEVFAVYNRKTNTWKFIPDAINPRCLIVGNELVVGMLHHPDPKTNSDFSQDERTTVTLERINPVTAERTVLVSSRRTPAQSPLDNKSALVHLHGAEAFLEREIVFMDFVFHLDTQKWRPLTKEDRELIQSRLKAWSNLEPWSGRICGVKFEKETGQLVISADLTEPTVDKNGKPTNTRRNYEISIPPVEIRVKDGALSAEEKKALLAPESFRYSRTEGGILAWNDRVLAVIPQTVYLPSVHRWLEENHVPK